MQIPRSGLVFKMAVPVDGVGRCGRPLTNHQHNEPEGDVRSLPRPLPCGNFWYIAQNRETSDMTFWHQIRYHKNLVFWLGLLMLGFPPFNQEPIMFAIEKVWGVGDGIHC